MKKNYNDTRDAIFNELYSLALKDKNIILLTADTGAFIFKEFKKQIPDQFYNVGIAEQNAISVAAGLTLSGKKVFIYGISNFVTLRCYEQIRIDICSMKLPVTILATGMGYIYGSDGPTHHMIENISVLRSLPEMTIWQSSDYCMTASLLHLAYKNNGPNCIFFDKGPFKHIYDHRKHNFEAGFCRVKKGQDITIISSGIMVTKALEIADELEKAKKIGVGVIDLYRLKPVDENFLIKELKKTKKIVTLEEHTIIGGLGSLVCQLLATNGHYKPIKVFGIPDTFRRQVGDREMLWRLDGIDTQSILKNIINWKK